LFRLALISETDFSLFKVTDDIEEAVGEITGFYRVFHSYRYVGDKLVMRLAKRLAEGEVERLNGEFGDLVKAGRMVQRGALEEEGDEPEMGMLGRVVFRHQRRDFGRLRQLIDAINRAETE
jgi:hypothetical protein